MARVGQIVPEPHDDEVAAIVAALELAWPRPVVDAGAAEDDTPRWRFSGRWWAKPVPASRQRPWR
jgi:hypothetical protein